MAQVWVTDQATPENGDPVVTKVKFVEVDGEGNPLSQSRTFSLEGDVMYVDAWVVKFDDELVEAGDPLRSASLCLFRRLFGEHQEPSDGYSLDNYDAPFVLLDEANQIAILETLDGAESEALKPGREFFDEMKRLTVQGYYTSRIGIAELNKNGVPDTYACTHESHA